jgi:hypothetical protein
MSVQNCPICGLQGAEYASGDATVYTCRRCGKFSLTGTGEAVIANRKLDSRTVANASGWIREHQGIQLTSYELEDLLQQRTPTVGERAMKLLQELARRHPNIGDKLTYEFPVVGSVDPSWIAVTWSSSIDEVQYLMVDYLQRTAHAISGEPDRTLDRSVRILSEQITPRGHELLEQLREGNPESPVGFCAMWFADDVRPLWTEAIEPAIRLAGYEPKRIDQHEHVNRIDDEIVAMIRRSRFVVADFTGQRGGVYFEAGYALGLGLRVIWLCREDQLKDVHFDTRQYNFLIWKPGEYADLAKPLQNRIEATLGRGPIKP